jgi:hypothetical protein
MSTATITSETLCADLRGEASHRANMHTLNPSRGQAYRDLEFEVISENEFRAKNTVGTGTDLLSLVLDAVESKNPVQFHEHWEGDGAVTIYWTRIN